MRREFLTILAYTCYRILEPILVSGAQPLHRYQAGGGISPLAPIMAVTSISILISSSISSACIIVAAGFAWPKNSRRRGQMVGNSARSGRM